MLHAIFDEHLTRWKLTRDSDPIVTRTSRLLPVRQEGVPAILKIAVGAEEKRGAALMTWWEGHGAARVLAHDGDVLLLERAMGGRSLAELTRSGRDDDASRIICEVVDILHGVSVRKAPPPRLAPLTTWFESLAAAAATHGGIFARSHAAAAELLAAPQDVVALHGDIHHGNILDFGVRGWLAIDPKGAIGERGFDYANLFCNPDRKTATAPGRLARQVEVVAEIARLDRARLLEWILAWAGLSAVWSIEDREPPDGALEVAAIAAGKLGT